MQIAKQISKLSMVSTAVAKQAISFSHESSLSDGMKYEDALFNALFGTQDMKIGVEAFIRKMKPKFVHS